MRDYIVEQSTGELIRNTFSIYFSNFLPLYLIYLIPVFPFVLISEYGQETADRMLVLTGEIMKILISVFTVSAMTIAISDICLGNNPSFFHAYRSIFNKNLLNYVLAWLLVMVITFVGSLLF